MIDYCGYCGRDFQRSRDEPEGVCGLCLNGPDRDRILDDIEYDLADRANDRDLAERATRGK